MVKIFADPRFKIRKNALKKSVLELMEEHGLPPEYVLNIAFVGKRKMKTVSATYHKKRVALPVLSFSYLDPQKKVPDSLAEEPLLGEIIICYPQALLLAAEREKSVNIMLLTLIRHGIENIIHS